jgi:hypothetical protein
MPDKYRDEEGAMRYDMHSALSEWTPALPKRSDGRELRRRNLHTLEPTKA